ncbi:UNVERIFIED_CONTAM: Chalcone--flavonone isomerase [Sesamum calycinum]|uniref:Chalcone-flavonone isomerase family protein n=1 Tax=Sesamum calycinum TaxID=2727403 RepID=A0AAW2RSI9_9LAMI
MTAPPSHRSPSRVLRVSAGGVRGLEIEGKFVKFTAIGVYLGSAVSSLAAKWKGKSAEELADSLDFFGDIVAGPFEKFTKVTMTLPLTGQQYSEKVVDNCVAYWKAVGKYTDAESEATKKFLQVFRNETFTWGLHSLHSVTSWIINSKQFNFKTQIISFSKDGSIPEHGTAVIENKQLSEAVLNQS